MTTKFPRAAVCAALDLYPAILHNWRDGPLAISKSGPMRLPEVLGLAVARALSRFSAPRRISLGAGAAAAAVAERDQPGYLLIFRSGRVWQYAILPEPTVPPGALQILLDLRMIRADVLGKLGVSDAA